MKVDELKRQGWTTIASGKPDIEGKLSFYPQLNKPGKHRMMLVATDQKGNIVPLSKSIEILVRRPSGSCPKCYNFTFPTGESRRVPAKLKASLGVKPELRKEWKYENEHQCTKCRRKFPESLILPYEE